ncbi:MAG TPA: lysylphosphatidylglycerol synthase transmembrane domain-containing protein [Gaiellaceae bacterium]|jgi:uncharacterized membrane protein YbhN (UPF0104 family)|nr:lysylphosphatidylglycerol synthase transmembrane domain-containing protein [Gaiellaceae bacterium]
MSTPERQAPHLDWRRVTLGGLLALAVGAAVVFVIGRAAGFAELEETIREGDLAWLTVCAIGQSVVFAGYAGVYRYAAAFEGGPAISAGLSLRVTMASFGLTQLVAAGGAVAMAVTYWAFRRLSFDRHDAAVRMIGLNTLVYLVFGLLGWSAALLALIGDDAPLAMTLPWLVLVPVVLLAARWFTDGRRVRRWSAPGGSWLRQGLAIGVGAAWWVRRSLVASDGRRMLPWALLYWAGDVLSLWGALHAFGAGLGLAAVLLAYATGYVANSVPLPFIATGAMDAATTFALHAVGVPLQIALLAVVAHRVFAFWLPLLPALVLSALLPSTGRALEEAARRREHEATDLAALT